MTIPGGAGQQRDLFLRALRAYSDDCVPPALTHDCPFSYSVEPGVRGCGEECLDVLGQHGAPPRDRVVPVGEGLEFRRRRKARVGPESTARAFDAAEIHMADEAVPDLGSWNSVSLLVDLRKRVATAPSPDRAKRDERRSKIEASLAELERRGFDRERLLRSGLATTISTGVVVWLMVSRLARRITESGAATALEVDEALASRWVPLILGDGDTLTEDDDKFEGQFRLRFGGPQTALLAWVDSAPLDSIIDWEPHAFTPHDDLPTDEYAWIVERLTSTYLHTWSEHSLAHEWRYLHGEQSPPCPSDQMRLRRVAKSLLSDEMAERSVAKDPRARAQAQAGDYVPVALRMLADGRRSEAAAVFEAVLAVQPRDATACNNYAFCVLPDDPGAAISKLDIARRLGRDDIICRANRLLALVLVGRLTAATDEIDVLLSTVENSGPTPAWLWNIKSVAKGEPEVEERMDAREYALDLVDHMAGLHASDGDSLRWLAKTAELRELIHGATPPPA